MTRKIINDPVHGFITINDPLILQIIEHPYYQRLSRIKQMAMAYLVYPGAVHTRFLHSLGAYHLMCNALSELIQKGCEISPEEQQAAKLAILLHDIGHGPFSHALEETLVNVKHEQISLLIMQKLNEEFNGALQLCMDIFLGNTEKLFLHQLVSSQLDVDRLDYLARDSFFTGVSEGVVGYDRIIKMLCVQNNQLMVEEKGIHSIENFLIARRLMYWQVYLHKTVLGAEVLLTKILQRAKELVLENQSVFASPTFMFFLENKFTLNDFLQNPNCLQQFIQLDDYDIFSAIKTWCHHSDKILNTLANKLINRKLFKTLILTDENIELIEKIKNDLKVKYSFTNQDLDYFLESNSTENMAYSSKDENIFISFKDGSCKDISTVDYSLINAGVAIPVKKYYICYSK